VLDRIVRRRNPQARRRSTYPKDLDDPPSSNLPALRSSVAASRDSSSAQRSSAAVSRASSSAQRSSAAASRDSSSDPVLDRIVRTYLGDPATCNSPARRSPAAASRGSSSEQARHRIVRRRNPQARRRNTYPKELDDPAMSNFPAQQSSVAASQDSSSEQVLDRIVRRRNLQARRRSTYPKDVGDPATSNSPALRSSVAAYLDLSSEQAPGQIVGRINHPQAGRRKNCPQLGDPAANSLPSRRYSKLRSHRTLPPVPQWIIAALSTRNAALTKVISMEASRLHSIRIESMPEGVKRTPATILKDACVDVRLAAKQWLIATRLLHIVREKAERSRLLLKHSRFLFRKCVPKLFAIACLIRLYHQILRRNFIRGAFNLPCTT